MCPLPLFFVEFRLLFDFPVSKWLSAFPFSLLNVNLDRFFFSPLKLLLSAIWRKLKPLHFFPEVISRGKETQLSNYLNGIAKFVVLEGQRGPETGKLCSSWSSG